MAVSFEHSWGTSTCGLCTCLGLLTACQLGSKKEVSRSRHSERQEAEAATEGLCLELPVSLLPYSSGPSSHRAHLDSKEWRNRFYLFSGEQWDGKYCAASFPVLGSMGEFRRQEVTHSLPRAGEKRRRRVLVDKTGKVSWNTLVDETKN